ACGALVSVVQLGRRGAAAPSLIFAHLLKPEEAFNESGCHGRRGGIKASATYDQAPETHGPHRW
ncbi:MAG TPA: hypothetical protein VH164_12775, partial [Ktedonobacteraceae bacterium]|nr:hypothetical protein [Ktedonobacteraceae bacterium]